MGIRNRAYREVAALAKSVATHADSRTGVGLLNDIDRYVGRSRAIPHGRGTGLPLPGRGRGSRFVPKHMRPSGSLDSLATWAPGVTRIPRGRGTGLGAAGVRVTKDGGSLYRTGGRSAARPIGHGELPRLSKYKDGGAGKRRAKKVAKYWAAGTATTAGIASFANSKTSSKKAGLPPGSQTGVYGM